MSTPGWGVPKSFMDALNKTSEDQMSYEITEYHFVLNMQNSKELFEWLRLVLKNKRRWIDTKVIAPIYGDDMKIVEPAKLRFDIWEIQDTFDGKNYASGFLVDKVKAIIIPSTIEDIETDIAWPQAWEINQAVDDIDADD